MPLGVSVAIDTSGVTDSVTATQDRSASLKAVKAGIKIISVAAKAGAPKKSGALRVAQGTKAAKGTRGKTGSYAVQGAKTKYKRFRKGKKIVPAFYDHLVIGGTRPHVIRKGSALEQTRKGVTTPAVGQEVGKPHPGARKNPYRLRAYRATRAAVMSEMKRVYGAELDKIFKKANAKTLANLKKSVTRKALKFLGG